MSYTLIERKELTSTASSIEFSSIPQFYTDILAKVSVRQSSNFGNPYAPASFALNSSSSNKTSRYLLGEGTGTSAPSYTEFYIWTPSNSTTANVFSNNEIYISNYAGSSNKSISVDSVTENNATANLNGIGAALWSNTAPVTTFTVNSIAGEFVAGSSVSLYGINRQQAIGAPKAVGGAISFANGHWYHTFTGSGSFTPKTSITDAEVLCIAGGGASGAASPGGGGGAGGVVYSSPVRFTANNHNVTVGAGGAPFGSGFTALPGNNGTSSSVTGGSLSLTAAIGGGGGGFFDNNPNAGNSGGSGGGGGSGGINGSVGLGGAGTAGQGFAGGNSARDSSARTSGGGGGGAGSAGTNGTGPTGGAGGSGTTNYSSWASATSTGVSGSYAGGGGGGADVTGGTASAGGGAGASSSQATAGTANTGGGGGGSAYSFANRGGGSGIVIIRYKA